MTNETKRRIKVYKRVLPVMRERIGAALISLIITMVVAVTATYAWVTLSAAPEVTRITTTLSSNGSLEIALSKPDASQPDETDIDESITYNNSIMESNRRWGNLINISDPGYGIDNLVLRPAQLNTASLATSPLWGAVYGEDGRITQLNSKYTYTVWDGSDFLVSSDYGVRAIASYITATSNQSAEEYDARYQELLDAHTAVNEYYRSHVATSANIGSLGSVMSTYLQSKLNEKGYGTSSDGNIALTTAQVTAVRNMYQSVYDAMDEEIKALLVLANLQQYIFAKEHDGMTYTEMTWDRLQSGQNKYDSAGSQHKKNPATPDEAVSIKGLKTFITNRNYAVSDIATLNALVDKSNSGTTVYSSELDTAVNHLCAPSSALIDNKSLDTWMAGSKTDLLGLTSGDHLATLGGGVLKVYEQMAIDTAYRLPNATNTSSNAANIRATAKYIITMQINMTGHICTNAAGNSYFSDDMSSIPTDINAGDKIAEDTYGMAVDFWVRTNSEGTYLMLEGATTIDPQTQEIIRYDGVNRVWGSTGNAALTTDSTTQGSGSCYIYYADTPEDSSRSLALLKSMKVAFVAPDGTDLAYAIMDTDHCYAVNGRYTVPLIIEEREKNAFTQENEYGEEITRYGIRYMTLDQSYMITAIVYIDGATLENTQVLSSTEIDGQLNLQFSSSEQLNTIGDNRLLTAERYVTAAVSKNSMDFDTATSDADLTTTVTATVSGIDASTVRAFFIRAVNATQGTRQEEMNFTKQSNGSWTADYTFDAPGTYYLRYIRADGVDYALANPPSVEVTGFALTGVTWNEPSDTHTVYSTDSSYNESVQVQFQSTDINRMPRSVQARFIRDDGNSVTVDTRFNASTRRWEGTRAFSASGTYTLSYLVLDGNYYDMSRFAKTLNLYLGMKAVVYNNNSELVVQYDTDHPETVYPKDIQAQILDNAGNALDGLTDVRLYYSLGGSSTSGVNTDLIWNDETGYYEGMLPLVRPGRYSFRSLQVGTNMLSRASEAPVYVVASPDPPSYVTSSESTYNSTVQFIPLQTSATIGPIKIDNSASAMLSAVVYNNETGEYHTVEMGSDVTRPGVMYYVGTGGGYWMINLPTYLKEDGSRDIRNGAWSVVEIKVYDCFDENAEYHGEEDPIIWIGTSAEASAYASQNGITPTARLNFDKLTTVVSNTVRISMSPGTTELGSRDDDFMSSYQVADIGMAVTVQDNAGRTIPSDKIGGVSLNLSYTANTDVAAYGYEVSALANKSYAIDMTFDSASQIWVPNDQSNYVWQYVGEYRVSGLTVTVNGSTQTSLPGENGVPARYTVTTKAPSGDDLTIGTPSQTTVFGKTGDTVDGKFLASYVPTTSVPVSMNILDADGRQYARVPDVTMKLALTYKDGTTAPNGAYSWTGSTGYESITLDMTPDANNRYRVTGSTPLLAGRYGASGTLYWTENGQQKSRSIGTLQDIQVWSVQPTLTVTGVSPTGEVAVNRNGDGAESYEYLVENSFDAQNRYGEYYAAVYMTYGHFTESNNVGTYSSYSSTAYSESFADYTAPQITLTGRNLGDHPSAFVLSRGTRSTSATMTDAGNTASIAVGWTELITATKAEGHDGTCSSDETDDFSYKAENAYILGTQRIESVTTTINGTVINRTLSNPITISQTNTEAPKLTYSAPTGMSFNVRQSADGIGVTSGSMVDGMTALTATVTAQEGYFNPRLTQPAGAMDWTVVSVGEEEAVYTFGMAFEDMSLTGSVSAYPKLSFSSGSDAAVTVSVNGQSISSGTGVKPGATVTVELTSKTENGYCRPRIATGGTTVSEGDYSAAYTFTMPSTATTLPGTTSTAMYRVSWANDAALTFTAVDHSEQDKAITVGAYVIPGHTVIVTLTADGGTNPQLTSPTGATAYGDSSNAFVRQYSFTMPGSAVTLAGTAEAYPSLVYGNGYATLALSSSGATVSTEGATEKGIRPGNSVTIILSALPGYKAPRMTQPSGVTNWSASDSTATYSFTMPNSAVNISGLITATGCTVSYDANGGSVGTASDTYAGSALTLPAATRAGYQFNGWYTAASGGTKAGNAGAGYTPAADIILHAQWTPYTVTYNYNGGSGSTSSATYGGSAMTLPTPAARAGYKFSGWYTAASGGTKAGDAGGSYTPSSNITLYAQWQGYKITFNYNGGSGSPASTTYSGNSSPATITLPSPNSRSGYSFNGWYTASSGGTKLGAAGASYTVTGDATLYAQWTKSSSCVASGTLITMADGSKKPVEDITLADELLIFNHDTGAYDIGTINFIESDGDGYYEVINLVFSDGTVSKTIYEHGYFDLDEMKYVYITEESYQNYVGHRFYTGSYDGSTYSFGEVVLERAYISTEYTGCFSLVTDYHLDYFTDGILSMPGGISGLFNIFEYGPSLGYDPDKMAQDIEQYGLFTFEDYEEILPYEIYLKYPADYLRVSLGKGLITWEYIYYLIARYAS